jgi:hypothetical protein
MSIFKVKPKYQGEYKTSLKPQEHSIETDKALKLLEMLGLERTSDKHFKCPYHESKGGHSLFMFEEGRLYCFHCLKTWNNVFDFAIQLCDERQDFKTKYVIEIIKSETYGKKC